MGVVGPALVQSDSGVVCPFLETFFKELTDRETRALTSNAMHAAAIGTFLMFCVAANTEELLRFAPCRAERGGSPGSPESCAPADSWGFASLAS